MEEAYSCAAEHGRGYVSDVYLLGICHQREFLNSVCCYCWLMFIGYWLLVICFGGEFWNDGPSCMFDERLMSNESQSSLVQN